MKRNLFLILTFLLLVSSAGAQKRPMSSKTLFDMTFGYSYQLSKNIYPKGSVGAKTENSAKHGLMYGAAVGFKLCNFIYLGPSVSFRNYLANDTPAMSSFYAPNLMFVVRNKDDRQAWRFGYQLGYLRMGLKMKELAIDKAWAASVGNAIDVSYDRRVGKKQWMVLKLSLITGKANELNYKTQNDNKTSVTIDDGVSLSSINFTLGFRFGN